ncbi:FBP domain-containing protein [Rothia sp. L_38]|uniref:FBP domain-containing protein n=1 Tax=Rothia sp. L_38 TaxID=3422315 RepID=UPI003D6AF1B6
MQELTEAAVRSSFINCSKGEAKRLNLPNLKEQNWGRPDFPLLARPEKPAQGLPGRRK